MVGAVSEISSLTIGSRVITAVRAGNGNLKLILWNVDSVGGIRRLFPPVNDADLAGEATHISIAQAGTNIVSAVRDGSSNLKIISWQIENNKLVRKGDTGTMAGEASLIRVINLSNSLLNCLPFRRR